MTITRTIAFIRVAALALAAMAITGCAALQAAARSDDVLAPVEGGAVVMRNGAALVVSLSPDPAVGYGWVLKNVGPNLVAVGGPDYMQDPKPPGTLGIAGATTFRFRAKSPGSSTIEFAWQAPPGQPATAARLVRYEVTVVPAGWFGIL